MCKVQQNATETRRQAGRLGGTRNGITSSNDQFEAVRHLGTNRSCGDASFERVISRRPLSHHSPSARSLSESWDSHPACRHMQSNLQFSERLEANPTASRTRT
jgi:hypothetical protein